MRILRPLIAAVALLTVSGCAFSPQLQRVAVNHNEMVAEVEDELTLLNIVRASHRFPLHFTVFSSVQGNARLTSGISLGSRHSAGPDELATGASLGVSTEPSFTLGVLSNEKFQRGIQKEIGTDLAAYYLNAGWRDELIMALLIERIDVVNADGTVVASIDNDPSADSRFAQFMCTHRLTVDPTLAARPLAHIGQLLDLRAGEGTANAAELKRKEIGAFLDLIGRSGVKLAEDRLMLTDSVSTLRIHPGEKNRCGPSEAVTRPEPPVGGARFVPRMRSTLGVLYFVGEYVRLSEAGSNRRGYELPFEDEDCPGTVRRRPLFDVRSGGGKALVDAELRGTRYFIPETAENRCSEHAAAPSMQVLSMLQQLLNLHQSADDLPTTISITGAN